MRYVLCLIECADNTGVSLQTTESIYRTAKNLQLAIQHVEVGINLDTLRRHTINNHWKGNNDICCAM